MSKKCCTRIHPGKAGYVGLCAWATPADAGQGVVADTNFAPDEILPSLRLVYNCTIRKLDVVSARPSPANSSETQARPIPVEHRGRSAGAACRARSGTQQRRARR